MYQNAALSCPIVFLFFVLVRLCSSHLLPASTYVFLCHLDPASSWNSFCFICLVFFRSSYLVVGVFAVLSYPVR